MRLRAAILTAVFLAGCGAPDVPRLIRPPSERDQPLVIVTFGDSVTAGVGVDPSEAYPALLQGLLDRAGVPASVINAGVSGDTTADGAARLDDVLAHDPDIVLIALGGNDYLRGLGEAQAEQNLRTIIERLRAERVYVVLAASQYPSTFGSGARTNRAIQHIHPRLASEYGIAVIPSFLKGIAGVSAMNQSDRIHPNAAGHRVIAEENVWPVLEVVVGR